jgi:hypothetical protein
VEGEQGVKTRKYPICDEEERRELEEHFQGCVGSHPSHSWARVSADVMFRQRCLNCGLEEWWNGFGDTFYARNGEVVDFLLARNVAEVVVPDEVIALSPRNGVYPHRGKAE